jgi:hypothetical protein
MDSHMDRRAPQSRNSCASCPRMRACADVASNGAWGSSARVALTARTLCIAHPYADSRFSQQADRKTHFVTRNTLTVPVLDEGGVCIAVIQAINRIVDFGSNSSSDSPSAAASESFSPEDVGIMESLAKSAGIILKKSKAMHATLLAERRARALLDLFKVVARADEVEFFETLDGVVEVLYQVLHPDRVTMYFNLYSYDLDTFQWSKAAGPGLMCMGAAMPAARYGHASCVYGGQAASLLIVGGCRSNNSYFKDAWSMDLHSKKWRKLEDLPLDLAYHSLVTWQDRAYLSGGYNGKSFVQHMYVLDSITGKWNILQTSGQVPPPMCGDSDGAARAGHVRSTPEGSHRRISSR